MADGSDNLLLRTYASIHDIDALAWNELANPSPAQFNPFISQEFLSALEDSKSVAPETGWTPMHIALEDNGVITGIAPFYAKGHSQGEYIFDHHWADTYERAGGRYYPKLLSASPFTPVQGGRLLAASQSAKLTLASAIRQLTERVGASSAHINFISETDQALLKGAGFLPRMGEQFHWFNRGYESFDEFLSALSSRKRKALRRERRDAIAKGGAEEVTIKKLVGPEIDEPYWDAFWLFYQDTGARKWGQPYLTRTFFRLLAERMPERLLMIIAEINDEPIAGALNLVGGDTLYGRYWGCSQHIPFLHFEVCYYQAIDFAIEHRLSRVEAGAQGEHKIARGYEPVPTYSAHWIRDVGFRDAIARYLDAEREQTSMEIEALRSYVPFKGNGKKEGS
ncbi:MAG: hypothetical protein DHS20C05_17800 [Hyphococcus sp.]|nr:MAG: hypothetical protein DHS20C05_17800 [Marinicaulis sp.]